MQWVAINWKFFLFSLKCTALVTSHSTIAEVWTSIYRQKRPVVESRARIIFRSFVDEKRFSSGRWRQADLDVASFRRRQSDVGLNVLQVLDLRRKESHLAKVQDLLKGRRGPKGFMDL